MNVILVSQCSKNALKETRRIIDQFAQRTGERTWSTAITKDGLDTLRTLLRKTARRNTAVACHRIRGKSGSELLWIVGDSTCFNESGAVPTNTTSKNILRSSDENNWNTLELITNLVCVAALFHDFGKSCKAFQKMLKSKKPQKSEIRHEWISVVMFMTFIGNDDDEAWLKKLADGQFEKNWYKKVTPVKKPFENMPPLAAVVCWLIVSHHKMPLPENSNGWTIKNIVAEWCRSQSDKPTESYWKLEKDISSSAEWKKAAAKTAAKALGCRDLFAKSIEDPYILNISRMVLMLADRIYSSLPSGSDNVRFDEKLDLLANTNRETKEPNQKLDEHLIGVEKYCRRILFSLPKSGEMLQSIGRNDVLTRRNKLQKYKWQDKAFDIASAVRDIAETGGFFGINMASTGCGKTIANARIMYALSGSRKGCRFTVALGLRSLTLQTGEEYRKMLGLSSDEMAVLVGGSATKELFEINNEHDIPLSEEELMPSCSFVHYDGGISDTPMSEWISRTKGGEKLIPAPVAVCTVDHIIPASEGIAGGGQLAPILRLMTGDLILDEPDDYDISDMYAFSRLVWFAGLLGCNVLLSSATVAPSIASGLFAAYRAGRSAFNRNRGLQHSRDVVCGWFDEYSSCAEMDINEEKFTEEHRKFAEKRAEKLKKAEKKRHCRLLNIEQFSFDNVAAAIAEKSVELHSDNHITDTHGNRVSVGLVRFANIKNLVAVIKRFKGEGAAFHLCCYHSAFPMLMRSEIERHLDRILKRNGGKQPFDHEYVRAAIASQPDKTDHIFIVFASPVAEVGRDHDYDWAIAEPSSMKSLIQLAGRVRRHRDGAWDKVNMLVLNKNINAYQGEKYAYWRPGYESKEFMLNNHDLNNILDFSQYAETDAVPRIIERGELNPAENLCDLEHSRLRAVMGIDGQNKARSVDAFWKTDLFMSALLQKEQKFRASALDTELVYVWDEDEEKAKFYEVTDKEETTKTYDDILYSAFAGAGSFFIPLDYERLLEELAEKLDKSMADCAKKFGRFTISNKTGIKKYTPCLGVYKEVE